MPVMPVELLGKAGLPKYNLQMVIGGYKAVNTLVGPARSGMDGSR